MKRQQRRAITGWRRWRDIFQSERVTEVGRQAPRAHTWINGRPATPMYLSAWCPVRLRGSLGAVYIEMVPTALVLDLITKEVIHIDYDMMYFEVIEWPKGDALVMCKYNQILGGIWVAKIDSASIPKAVRDAGIDHH